MQAVRLLGTIVEDGVRLCRIERDIDELLKSEDY